MTNCSVPNSGSTGVKPPNSPSVSQSPLAAGFPAWDLVPPALLVRRRPKPTRSQEPPPLSSQAPARGANPQPPPSRSEEDPK